MNHEFLDLLTRSRIVFFLFFFCGQVNKMLFLTHIAPPIVVRIFGAAEVKSVYFVFFFFWPKPVPGPGKKCMSPIWTATISQLSVLGQEIERISNSSCDLIATGEFKWHWP